MGVQSLYSTAPADWTMHTLGQAGNISSTESNVNIHQVKAWNATVISRTLVVGGGLTPLQRCSQCILQPQGDLITSTLCGHVMQPRRPTRSDGRERERERVRELHAVRTT